MDVVDADVDVVVTVTPVTTGAVDENGWPIGFFDRVAGSMPDLRRGSPGEFEERPPLEADLSSGHQRLHFAALAETAPAHRPLRAEHGRRGRQLLELVERGPNDRVRAARIQILLSTPALT